MLLLRGVPTVASAAATTSAAARRAVAPAYLLPLMSWMPTTATSTVASAGLGAPLAGVAIAGRAASSTAAAWAPPAPRVARPAVASADHPTVSEVAVAAAAAAARSPTPAPQRRWVNPPERSRPLPPPPSPSGAASETVAAATRRVAPDGIRPLDDTFGRTHTYLRISLTERCNLRCRYCMPADGVTLTPPDSTLTTPEILRLAALFVRSGVTKIRLTGGEPLVRPDAVAVVAGLSALPGLASLGMTTNGLTLERHVPALRDAGLTALNVSLDTLVPARFELITRRRGQGRVLHAVDAALDAGFASVKLNVVVMRGVNEDEVVDFVGLTRDRPLDVRFIEYMPFGGNAWSDARFVSYAEMLGAIGEATGAIERVVDDPHDTCKHYRVPGYTGRIGFISSMTNHFCGGCNRLRLTADGSLKVCLFGSDEVSLRDVMRGGGDR
ncbi:hypothetical protein MMPV_000255 [Pyropia vietnamensis]